ncbi:Anaerobic dimethyl sulfoxide reductase chain C [Candidatus Rhodobacter oscarellae]|uniref:Anaerobic dimethyl sulfoxide reductase chain C n=1 Tax=Candidatus Rhodobacter oscarellae TaxID=1675527 RepID=A0A0J9E5Y2_9RHOB|nr:DmsC/YnfH family molybdoenzyme membrane anchor subunit [Candidatus Rhodobacter lobularis]KMW58122.1 Anaerobic dimethyl sulfoxide reductase chain C [Candidatus Rhodobacter lobularis]
MHPAGSIIVFTALSGLGFGMLFWLGLGHFTPTYWTGFVFFAVAYALSVGGLLASTFHLGHPERALKAFTQWRSSWLSREGWLACITLGVMGLYAAALVFAGAWLAPLGWLGAVGSLVTVYATSMIYAQLKTVPRWNHWTTNVLFLGLSLGGGALLTGAVWPAIVLLLSTAAVQVYAWRAGDQRLAESGTDMATATGLGGIGAVTAFEPPHTGGNYLTHEMVFVVGRKHARKLQNIALILGFALPVLLLMLPSSHLLALLAIGLHLAGLFVLRWLFFAQAEHVVGLYYGKR